MPRGLWKGAISFGLVNVPVELFSAEKRSTELDLTLGQTGEITPPEKEGRREQGAEVIDLMALLKKSVGKKPAHKAEHSRPKRARAKRRAA